MRNLQTDICGPGEDWQNGKRHPGQIIYGQNSGEECQRMLGRGRIWKGDIMVADIEELEEMDASELHARRLDAKEVLSLPQMEVFF